MLAVAFTVAALLSLSTNARGARRICAKPSCKARVSTFSLGLWQVMTSELTLPDSKATVTTQPLTLSYISNMKAGKSAVFHLSLETFYTPVAYTIAQVERKGSFLLAGVGGGALWMFRARNWLHGIYARLALYPFSQFSVKSTSTTAVTTAETTQTITTQTVLIYSGSVGTRLELGFLRYMKGFGRRSNIHYGIAMGILYQPFSKQSEQSLQKAEGEEAILRSPVTTAVKVNYLASAIALILGVDL